MRHWWFLLAVLMGLALQAAPASAALTYTFNCSTKNCTGSGGNNNFGTVVLTPGASGHVTVSVTLAANETFANLSSGYAILWDITGSPNLTITPQGSNSSDFAVQNSGNPGLYLASPFGHNNNNCNGANAASCFDYAVARSDISGSDTALVFDVTSTNGISLSSFTNSSEGFSFAAMINQSGNTTPFYVASNAAPVPEPQTWTMSIAGLAGLAGLLMLQRRRRSRARP
jgi:MYXO-CTERM domain-containing protein